MSDQRGLLAADAPAFDLSRLAHVTGVPAPVETPGFWHSAFTISQNVAGYDELEQAEQQAAVEKAYDPIIAELKQRGIDDSYTWSLPGGDPWYNEGRIFKGIARARTIDPSAFKDVPDDPQAFRARAVAPVAAKYAERNEIEANAGWGAWLTGQFLGSLSDPINLVGMLDGAAEARTVIKAALRDAAVNTRLTAMQMPAQAIEQAALGNEVTPGQEAEQLGVSAIVGAAGGATIKTGDIAARTAFGRLADQVRAAVPPEQRTAQEHAAIATLDRADETIRTSPFTPGAATDTHMAKMDWALRTLADPPDGDIADAPVRRETSPVARAAAGSIASLSRDNVIRFVLHDLEGGEQVVHYGTHDGGTTKYGIAAVANPGVNIAGLSEDGAAAIARRKYWQPGLDRMDPREAAVVFDADFIGGEKMMRPVLEAANRGGWREAIDAYRTRLARIAAKDPAKARYAEGWNHRVDKLTAFIERNGGDHDGPVLRRDQFAGDEAGDAEWRASQAAVDAEHAAETAASVGRREQAPDAIGDPRTWGIDEPNAGGSAIGDAAATPEASPAAAWHEAVERLSVAQEGEAPAALYHPDVGPIDVKWGEAGTGKSDGYGLAKIVKYHPEVLDNLPELLGEMQMVERGRNRIRLASADHRAVVRLDWDGKEQHWLLTAYEARAEKIEAPTTPEDGRDADDGRDGSPDRGATPDIGARTASGKPMAADPAVADYVDRYLAGEGRGDGEADRRLQQFAANHADEIEREFSRRAAGTPAFRLRDDVPAPDVTGFDHPGDIAAERQSDSLEHDVRMLLDTPEGKDMTVQLDDEGKAVKAVDALADADEDLAAIEKARACLKPPAGDDA